MFSRVVLLCVAMSVMSQPAGAYEDPVGDEIQRRMQQEEQQRINDMVAGQDAWGEGDDYGYAEPPAYSEEEWQDWAALSDAAERERLANDPQYQAFLNGEWLYTPPAKADTQACSILFLRRGVGAMVLATGGPKDPAVFAFFSLDVPRPDVVVETRATLSQTDAQPATVSVFNTALPWMHDFGIVFFAVPSAQAALDGMLETQDFQVSMNGRDVAAITWTGGLEARDRLTSCLNARR